MAIYYNSTGCRALLIRHQLQYEAARNSELKFIHAEP